MKAKLIIEWLRQKLGEGICDDKDNKFWIEHGYAFGSTESGFDSGYEINYDELEREMDAWIKETFPDANTSGK
jgi:hypothetical protein